MKMTKGLDTYTNIVYEIKNKINGKRYIGITTNTISERYHFSLMHHHNKHLSNSVKKYGEESFEFNILEKNVKDLETLCKLEMDYIDKFDACNKEKGYNKSLGGLGVRLPQPFSEEHCRNISKAKKGINPLKNYTPEQMARRNAKLSRALRGKNNHRYGMTKDKLKPETIEKLRQASLGENNPMYGKNIKDYMTEKAYEEWKMKIANPGAKNGRARKTIVVYKGQEYVFDYCRQAINYFKEFKGEPITVNWIYRGINPNYQDRFQFFGYEEDYKKYKGNKALAI
jgi:group I intron endonuclease